MIKFNFFKRGIFMATLCGTIAVSSCNKPSSENTEQEEKTTGESQPLNVILLIGDGMGLSQVSSDFFYNDNPSNFARFTTIGLIKTSSAKQRITDSAAGATAFACGEKTYNGAIGVDVNGQPVKSIIDILEGKNYKTGLIATSSITHATPAAFYAKADSRSKEELIATQMPKSGVDFFAGGGFQFFGKREDGANYIDSLKANGYMVNTDSLTQPQNLQQDAKYGFLLADEGMPTMNDGRGNFLPQATNTAIQFLGGSEKPFFMMVEGSQIDWGGHANNAEYLISEVIDFDHAIGQALDFAKKNGNTLVVVTADHETGGFTLSSKTVEDKDGKASSDYNQIEPTFSTGGHSATLIPVFAYGPGSENFSGIYENTEIFNKILALTSK